MMRKSLRRLTQEMSTLSTSLPLSLCSSILIAHDEDRLDVYKYVLLAHPLTCYLYFDNHNK